MAHSPRSSIGKDRFRLVFLFSGFDGQELLEDSLTSFRNFNPEIEISIYLTDPKLKAGLSSRPPFNYSELILTRDSNELDPGTIGIERFGDYGSKLFNSRTALKWSIMRDAMERHQCNILFSDIDIICLRPLPMQDFTCILQGYNIFIQDEGANTHPKSPCTGFMGFKNCKENIDLFSELDSIHAGKKGLYNDQDAFRAKLFANEAILKKTYFLSQYLFPVGYLAPAILNTSGLITLKPNNNPYIFHANWVVGLDAKKSLMELFISEGTKPKASSVEFAQAKDTAETKPASNTFPLVSICTPTHNRSQFLPLLKNCIATQDYPLERIQWVIVDDSTDNSKPQFNLGNEAFDIKYQRVKEKMNLGAKRNLSHRLCDGEFIVYMDDDDYYFPSRVSHSVRRLLAEKGEIAGASSLFIYFTHINETWLSGPFAEKHATAGTFAMTKAFARSQKYKPDDCSNEERRFLNDYTIPMIQLEPQHTMICISHEANTFDKKKMIANGKTQRMRPLTTQETRWITEDVNLLAYKNLV